MAALHPNVVSERLDRIETQVQELRDALRKAERAMKAARPPPDKPKAEKPKEK